MSEKIAVLFILFCMWFCACAGFYTVRDSAGNVAVLYEAATDVDYFVPPPERVDQENRMQALTGYERPDPYEQIPVRDPVNWELVR